MSESSNSNPDNSNSNASRTNASTVPAGHQGGPPITLQPNQVIELSNKFKALVNEAKQLGGDNSQRGKELLIQASKIKAIYDTYNRQRQAAAAAAAAQARVQAQVQVQSSDVNKELPTSTANNNNIGATPSANTPTPNSIPISNSNTPSSLNANNGNRLSSNQLASIMKQVLTPEQNQEYDKLVSTFQTRAAAIKEKHSFVKQNIERLSQELNKPNLDPNLKTQLENKKTELFNTIRAITVEHNTLHQQFQTGQKTFYVECAKNNPALQNCYKKFPTTTSCQATTTTTTTTTTAAAAAAATTTATTTSNNNNNYINSNSNSNNNNNNNYSSNKSKQIIVQSHRTVFHQPSPQQAGSPNLPIKNNTTNTTSNNVTPVMNTTKQHPSLQNKSNEPVTSEPPTTTTTTTTTPNNANLTKSQSVTNVNAAASASSVHPSNKSIMFKPAEPIVNISDTISTKQPISVPYRSNRPSLTGGSAMNASALTTPVATKLPPYEIDTERVMSKRKLRELVKSIGVDEGDGETVIDGDVEELLLDLADDFVTNVTSFACRLAKHRNSDSLEPRDIQLHLEKNWNIRIPGYSADEIRSIRKWHPIQNYNQKLQHINNDKANSSAAAAAAAAASTNANTTNIPASKKQKLNK
ncbi:Taf12p NDAI_0J01020 [Naumovozyma dairenensis CBS 421]|uniref:TBP-associated factor 12 n=1 Tax=Naumovozyma dairenensis (strain ATCC 10597 / BCRC 20456 / CBS 421 / NBRC 0211 / NRRL Y-12639) TaxID=1071378 RepID=G0WGR6_NAUDC|nr:hypothetical protein NDAI_0J01020 [Naumovozyma dairenensis CBS 421]CCD26994.1 hypothetical protein NDAI_0J01020 [Naumovozyma dairenensis CBS 421]